MRAGTSDVSEPADGAPADVSAFEPPRFVHVVKVRDGAGFELPADVDLHTTREGRTTLTVRLPTAAVADDAPASPAALALYLRTEANRLHEAVKRIAALPAGARALDPEHIAERLASGVGGLHDLADELLRHATHAARKAARHG